MQDPKITHDQIDPRVENARVRANHRTSTVGNDELENDRTNGENFVAYYFSDDSVYSVAHKK